MKKVIISVLLLFLALAFLEAEEIDFSHIKNRVSEFTLENGLKFLLLEDHSVPIASVVTYVNVGGSDERIGIYGISHFLEHLAFKGTSEIGTKNHRAEKKVFDRMDGVFEKIRTEKNKIAPDEEKIKKWEGELETLKEEAAQYVVSNELDTILKRHGAVNLNAGTSKDFTIYLVRFPSNKLELWSYLESSRFKDPVFREFYKERDVIQEERRMVIENRPIGKLVEEMHALAFKDHPYKIYVVGPMSNISNITRGDVKAYFAAHYTAANMVIGIAGDVYPQQLKKLAKKYFSDLKPGKKNPLVHTVEPPQAGEKTITIYEESQPWLMVGFHCPSFREKDYTTFKVLNYILSDGRSSRLYKKMVIQDKTAMNFATFLGFPGDKYPGLYLLIALPNSGFKTAELEKTIMEEIEQLKKEPISAEELKSAKTRIRVGILKNMQSPLMSLVGLLKSEILKGSWERAFDEIGEIEKVTAGDIREVANRYFTRNNRAIARIEKKEEVKK